MKKKEAAADMAGVSEKYLTFFEHLEELRARIIRLLIILAAFSCLLFNYTGPLLEMLIRPVGRVVFSAPTEAFSVRFVLALALGLVAAMPFLLYEIWQFASQALMPAEKRATLLFVPLAFLFFICGCAFAYFVMLPMMLGFFLSFSTSYMAPMIIVGKYISFIVTIILSTGLMFELPLAIAFLTRIGIATPAFLKDKRRHAIVWIFIVSAVLTPSPDIVSQVLMAGPLIMLYELSILFSRFVFRRLEQAPLL